MELYVTGVAVAAILGLAELLTILCDTFSTRFNNFKKAGLYFDPIKEQFYTHKTSWKGWAFLVASLILITPLFSWLSIGFSIINLLKKYVRKAQLPEKVKEIEFKLSESELPKDIAIELINELNIFYYGMKDLNLYRNDLGKTGKHLAL